MNKFFSCLLCLTFSFALMAKNKSMGQLAGEILRLQKAHLKCNSDKDCLALPMGAKACGGPDNFIVVSQLNPNFSKIQSKLALLKEMQIEHNKKSNLSSTCDVVLEPQVHCDKKMMCSISPKS